MSPVFLVPLIYLVSMLQIGLAPHWQIAGAGPDLLALLAVLWTVKSTGSHALATAALIGFGSDLNSTMPLGVGMALYALIAYGVVWWRRQVKLDRLSAQIAVVWSGITAIVLLEHIAGSCLGRTMSLGLAIEGTAVVGLYSTMIAIPVLLVMSWRRSAGDPRLSIAAVPPS
jgi:rod shape-determining protein MreD